MAALEFLDRGRVFTLIERPAHLKRAGFLIDGSSIPTNFPFRVGSLTPGPGPATDDGYRVTMSREGKPAARVDHGLHLRHSLETERRPIAGHLKRNDQATRSQSERLGQRVPTRRDRQTNDRKPRKGTRGGSGGQSQGRREEASLCSMGEVGPPWGRKWEDAPTCPDGAKGDGMRGRVRVVKSGENLQGSAGRRIRTGIRRIVESRPEALQGVGDGHSTEDPKTMKNFGEGRAVSLERPGGKEVPA